MQLERFILNANQRLQTPQRGSEYLRYEPNTEQLARDQRAHADDL